MNPLGSGTVWHQFYKEDYFIEYVNRSNNILCLLNKKLTNIDKALGDVLEKISILEERVSLLESSSREGKLIETTKWPSGMPMQVKQFNHIVSNRTAESRRHGGKGRKWNEDQTSEDTLAISGSVLHNSSSSSTSGSCSTTST